MRQARRKMNPVDSFVAGRKDCDSRPMSSRAVLLLVCLSGLACAGPAVAAETFGLQGGQAALAARAQVECVELAQALDWLADWSGFLAWVQYWALVDAKKPQTKFVQG